MLIDFFISFPEYLYKDYKDKTCKAKIWESTGCYKTNNNFVRGEMLVYWRYDIEWSKERMPHFANRLVSLFTYLFIYFTFIRHTCLIVEIVEKE